MAVSADLAAQRAQAEGVLANAESFMRKQAHDPALFQAAKAQRQAALDDLERIRLAEENAAEQAAEAEQAAKREQLRAAQEDARAAKEHAAVVLEQLPQVVADLTAWVRQLQKANSDVERGVHFEAYGVRDGMIERPTVAPGLGVDSEIAIQVLRAAQELVRLSPVSLQVAEQKARQRSL